MWKDLTKYGDFCRMMRIQTKIRLCCLNAPVDKWRSVLLPSSVRREGDTRRVRDRETERKREGEIDRQAETEQERKTEKQLEGERGRREAKPDRVS